MATPNPYTTALLDPYAASRQAMRFPSLAMPDYESLLNPQPYSNPYYQQQSYSNPYAQDQIAISSPLAVQGELLDPEQPFAPTPVDRVFNEEQSGIARRLATNLGSTLGYVSDSLDKIGSRQIRGLLGGKPRELLSFIPFSDLLGITNPEDIVSGGDLLGTRKKRGLGYRIAEFGTELLLDPTMLFGLGFGKKALNASGKAALASGILDDLGVVAKSRGMGRRAAQGSLTPRDIIEYANPLPSGTTSSQRMQDFTTAVAKAEGIEPTALQAATLDKYLDETLGGFGRIKVPFGKEVIFGGQSQIANLKGVPGLRRMGKFADYVAQSKPLQKLASNPLTASLNSRGPSTSPAGHVARVVAAYTDGAFSLASKVVTKPLEVVSNVSRNPAKAMDDLSTDLMTSKPGVIAKRMFHAPSMDGATKYEQQVGEKTYWELAAAKQSVREEMHRMATALMNQIQQSGANPQELSKRIRIAAEARKYFDQATSQWVQRDLNLAFPDVAEYATSMGHRLDGLLEESEHVGVPLDELVDLIAYFPRYVSSFLDKKGLDRIHNAFDPSQNARADYLRGWFGPGFEGTETIKQIISSSDVESIMQQGMSHKDTRDSLISLLKEPQYTDLYGAGASPINPTSQLPFRAADHDQIAEGLADFIMQLGDQGRAAGGYANDPIVDYGRRMLSGKESIIRMRNVLDWLADDVNHISGPDSMSVLDLLEEAGRPSRGGKLNIRLGSKDTRGAIHYVYEQYMSKKLGAPFSLPSTNSANEWKLIRQELQSMHVPADAAPGFFRFLDSPSLPKSVHWAHDIWDSFSSLFKAGVLTRPSRYPRDFLGAVHTNWTIGAFNPKDYLKAYKYITGDHVDLDLTDIAEIRQRLTASGRPIDKKNALDEFNSIMAAHNVADTNTMAPNVVSAADPVGGGMRTLDDVLGMAPGLRPTANPFKLASLKKIFPQSLEEADPLNIRGSMIGSGGAGKRMETKFSPAKWGEDAGQFTEFVNRVGPMITLMRSGNSAATAAKKVLAAHADYSPDAFTTFERHIMARVFPFYRFTRKMIPFHLQALIEEPGGKMRQTMRLINSMRDRNSPLPEHIAQTAAIEIPGAPEGQQRFLTGFGLPMEDVFGLMRPHLNLYKTIQGTGQELIGRMSPLAKAPIEIISGTQMHSGRDLEDLRGTLSDLVFNLGLTDSPPNTPILLEQAVSNSPVSGMLNIAKQAIDPRKGLFTKALNLTTGLRFSDADLVKARNLAIREALEDLLRQNPNVHRFSHLYAPDDAMLSPEDQVLMDMYRAAGAQAAKDSRERKKAAAAAK